MFLSCTLFVYTSLSLPLSPPFPLLTDNLTDLDNKEMSSSDLMLSRF